MCFPDAPYHARAPVHQLPNKLATTHCYNTEQQVKCSDTAN